MACTTRSIAMTNVPPFLFHQCDAVLATRLASEALSILERRKNGPDLSQSATRLIE